jgi:ATP-dependent Zn protease
VLVSANNISGKLRDDTAFTTVRVDDLELTQMLEAHGVEIRGQVENSGGGILGFLMIWIFPMVLMIGFCGTGSSGETKVGLVVP